MPQEIVRIVVADPFPAEAVERLRAAGEVSHTEPGDLKGLEAAIAHCDALLVRSQTQVSRALLDRAGRMRVIGRAGVGLENIDLEAAREKSISVVYTPAASTDAVADLTVGMMIAALRRVPWCDTMIRAGQFEPARRRCIAGEMSELQLGIIGMGRIGRAVARRCRNGFGMNVLFNDIVDPGWLDFSARSVSKEELFGACDIVSLHVPLSDQTRNLIDAKALTQFKRGSILINTARGAVIDSHAVAQALHDGVLAGAALDVFDPEPPPPDHPILRAPNTLLTPHIGARTHGGQSRMAAVVDDVIRVLQGQAPHYPA